LYNLCQIPDVSGALVAIDPHTGRVLAMSGGFSFEMSQFNRATQAKRQEGSSIKPFVYLTALEHGFTPSTLILDTPIALDQCHGGPDRRNRRVGRPGENGRELWHYGQDAASIFDVAWRRRDDAAAP